MYGKIWIVDSPQQNCEHPRTLTGKVCDTVSTRSLDISGNCTVIVWIFRKEFHEILRHQIEFKASKELRHLDHDHFRSLRPSCLCRCSDLRSKVRYQRVSGFRPLRGKQDSVKFLGKTNCGYRQLNPCLSIFVHLVSDPAEIPAAANPHKQQHWHGKNSFWTNDLPLQEETKRM